MFEYSPEFLRWNFEGPTADEDFIQEVYDNGEFAGFYAGVFRRFSLSGREVKTVLESFLAAVPGIRPALPLYISRRESKLLREKGYAGCIQVFDESFSNLDLMSLLARKHKVRMEQVAIVDWQYRIFDVKRLNHCEPLNILERCILSLKRKIASPGPLADCVRPYEKKDLEACLELLNSIEKRARQPYLVRLWDAEELDWQLRYSGVADTLVFEREGKAVGLINYYHTYCVNRTREPGTVIDNICLGDMTSEESRAFLLRAQQIFVEAGSIMVGTIDSNLLDRRALRRTGFIKARRPVKLVAGVVDEAVSFEGLRDIYFDIR